LSYSTIAQIKAERRDASREKRNQKEKREKKKGKEEEGKEEEENKEEEGEIVVVEELMFQEGVGVMVVLEKKRIIFKDATCSCFLSCNSNNV
jgi:hypothetical protein